MRTARVFTNGNSQAVRLPKDFRLAADEVFIRKDPVTGDIVLSARPPAGSWNDFFTLRAKTRLPVDLLVDRPLNEARSMRDPFATRTSRRHAAK